MLKDNFDRFEDVGNIFFISFFYFFGNFSIYHYYTNRPNVNTKYQTSNLSTRHFIRPIPRSRKLGTSILIPLKLLRPDCSRAPSVRRIAHSMIHNPVLACIGGLGETRMSNAVRFFKRVLVEHASGCGFAPVLLIHWVWAYEFELA
jgi:hypothetical protein